jgi:hypothetical protein
MKTLNLILFAILVAGIQASAAGSCKDRRDTRQNEKEQQVAAKAQANSTLGNQAAPAPAKPQGVPSSQR